jgi:hypothetical protein
VLLGLLGAAGVGTGAAARGIMAIRDNATTPKYDPLLYSTSIPTPVPVPIQPGQPKPARRPMAALPGEEEEAQPLAKLAELLRKRADPVQSLANAIVPEGLPANQPLNSTWGIPAAAAVTGGGLVGGWQLMKWLAGRNRRGGVENTLTSAEDEYQKALAEQYRAAMRAKNAGDSLGIDDLFDVLTSRQKAAAENSSFLPLPDAYVAARNLVTAPHRMVGNVAGYLSGQGDVGTQTNNVFWGATDLATLLGGLGTGLMTYNWVKKRDKQKILEKAVQMRARQRQFTPSPFYAVPEPVRG